MHIKGKRIMFELPSMKNGVLYLNKQRPQENINIRRWCFWHWFSGGHACLWDKKPSGSGKVTT